MEIKELFKGIAVVIDDQVNEKNSSISKIVTFLKTENIPVVAYDEIPSVDVISSLQNASFVILDWEYNNIGMALPEGGVIKPSSLESETKDDLLNFIEQILSTIFVPIFLFTDQEPDSIKDSLKSRGLYFDNKPNRVFIKRKSELNTYDELIDAIKIWIQQMPSVYVLKKWEKALNSTKNKMFLEMYGYSANWVKIIWDMLKLDSRENRQEFGEFLTRNFVNRIGIMDFAEDYMTNSDGFSNEELRCVLEGERYVKYDAEVNQAYTGDLFYNDEDNTYYLNIRAQCDLARRDNPELYCLNGQVLSDADIVTEDIQLTSEGKIRFTPELEFILDELQEVWSDENRLKEFNKNFIKHRDGRFFSNGVVLERGPEVIIACVAGNKIIRFRMDIKIKKFNSIKKYRIGRILPPYITRIQQKCSQHIIREGTMPLPQDIFN